MIALPPPTAAELAADAAGWAAYRRHDAAYAAWRRARALHLRLEGRAAELMARYREGDPTAYEPWQAAERLALRAWDVRSDARERQDAAYRALYQSGPLS